MDFNDFIIGEKYNISALAIEGSFAGKKYAVFKLPTGRTFLLRAEDFEAVSPENDIKNTDTAPKYNPKRHFRKGDKVRVAENKGRCLKPSALKIGDVLTVSKDEPNDDTCVIWCKWYDRDFYLDPAYLELVTPVGPEPYYVKNIIKGYAVYKMGAGDLAASSVFWDKYHPHAKKAAEDECARLNAEWRKEQSNG